MELQLLPRTSKPREKGITAITDVGLSTNELRSILEDYHEFLDIAKFGIGTAYITPNLEKKISLYREYNVDVYFGGTLFEKFYYQDKMAEYLSFLQQYNVNMIEISTGTVKISLEDRLLLIEKLRQNSNLEIIAEVGSKDPQNNMAPSEWINELSALLEAGCKYVITEGRDSATAGLYKSNGEIKKDLVEEIINHLDSSKIIYEAPTPKTQMFFINLLGSDVNLGNVAAKDLVLLETQRRGLRSETFFKE